MSSFFLNEYQHYVFVVTIWQGPGPLPEEVNNDCDRIVNDPFNESF